MSDQLNLNIQKKMTEYDEFRKQSDSVFLEQQNQMTVDQFLTQQAEYQGFEVIESDYQTIKSSSLSKMETGEERINKKDRDTYIGEQKKQREALKTELGDHDIKSSPEMVEALSEYKQLVENARVFDNEVRDTVRETIRKHPAFFGQLSEEERTVKLSRLVTAFLPEREFLMDPPTKKQRTLVASFLKRFKKDPVGEISKMQADSEESRTHKDLMDAANAGASYRMLYCEMRKREILGEVYPLACANTEGFEEKSKQVHDYSLTVDAYKVMLTNLMKANGIDAPIPENLEYNSNYVDVRTFKKADGKSLSSKEKKEYLKQNRQTELNLFDSLRFNLNSEKKIGLENYIG
ncbi:MAG: hypothetical protein J6N76_03850, partial [Lachnospiraceae bacterium]|nr:hypothetical protein [Lachnospiraceae bacterium]